MKVWGSLGDALLARTPQIQSRWRGLARKDPHLKSRNLSCPWPGSHVALGGLCRKEERGPALRASRNYTSCSSVGLGCCLCQIQSHVQAGR